MLAVGDAAFQQKCFEQFEQLKREGRTIVLVTHDMSAVQRFCDRAMLIDRGKLLSVGDPHEIALAYNELNFGRLVEDLDAGGDRYGDHAAAEIKDAWFENDAGERITELAQGEPCTMCMEVFFHAALDEPVFAFHLRNEPRHIVFATSSEWQLARGRAASRPARRRVSACDSTTGSRRSATRSARRSPARAGDDVLDLREDLATLLVTGTRVTGGLADVPHEFAVERR